MQRWWSIADAQVAAARAGGPPVDGADAGLARDAAMRDVRGFNEEYQRAVGAAHVRALDDATRAATIGVLAAGAAFLLVGYALVVRAQRRRARRAELDARYTEQMLFAASAPEATTLLRGYLIDAIPGAEIDVLAADDDRRSRCHASFTGGAVSHPAGPGEAPCDVCSSVGRVGVCTPLRAGGAVVGAVVVGAARTAQLDGRAIDHAVGYAAPVLAHLHTLERAESRAATDALTGLPNRRAVDTVLPLLLARAARHREPLAAVMLDIDHFKAINDRWGHDRGDEVLAHVAAQLRATVRASDFVGRSGGEEFLLLLPQTDLAQAGVVAEKVRGAVAATTFSELDVRVTASLGVAVFPDHGTTEAELLRAADAAMYRAKGLGRNGVACAATPEVAPAMPQESPAATAAMDGARR